VPRALPRRLPRLAPGALAWALAAALLGAALTAAPATPVRAARPRTAPAAATASTDPVVEHPARPAGTGGVATDLTPLVADFDGDGADDVLWYGPGTLPDHLWRGAGTAEFYGVPIAVGGTYDPVVGDFNGDHRADVLWYAPGPGTDIVWFGGPEGRFTGRVVSVDGPYQPIPGDFNGDGRTDLIWYAPGTVHDVLWLAGAHGVFTSHAVNVNGTYRPVVGDFDGDRAADVLWYGAGSAPDALWYGGPSAAFHYRAVSVGGSYEPVVADFNGDARRDVLWYAPGAGADVGWYGLAARHGFSGAGLSLPENGQAVPGDFNGDGRGDLVVYGGGPGADAVYYGRTTKAFDKVNVAVNASYTVTAGDFGGDGHTDVFWYAPGNARDVIWSGLGHSFSSRVTTIDIGYVRPLPLRPETIRDQYNPYGFVAHEMGGIDGWVYTNTLEAFQQNYARGYRVFESDQSVLADGTVLLAHDHLEANYGLDKPFEDATWADLEGHKYKDKLTILRAQDLLQLMTDHPDIYVILDFKNDDTTAWDTYVKLANGNTALIDRLFPHVVDPVMLKTMRRSYPVQNYVVALYKSQGYGRLDDPEVLDWARRERIPALMMWKNPRDWSLSLPANQQQQRRYDPELVAGLKAAGTVVYVHTVDDKDEGQARWDERVGMYTNWLFPPFEDQQSATPTPTPTSTPTSTPTVTPVS
jgi:glycerophosphoryl diester phosphodiesterase